MASSVSSLPTIHVTASKLSTTAVSLSKPASSDPVTLTLTLILRSATTAMTVYASRSLFATTQKYGSSFYYLQNTDTGASLHSSYAHLLRTPYKQIDLDSGEFLTLYPDQPVEHQIQLGLFARAPPPRMEEKDHGRLRTLCGSHLSHLEAGATYRILHRSQDGSFGLDWWMPGDKEEMERRCGGDGQRKFNIELVLGVMRTRPQIDWEVGEEAKIKILE
ncbi:MAG: hypothetical protein M1820_005564 [Bogoriella megaspora]|nr:MAG: hypothetical protein M1820_005564 [Bogoriella megaspora]